MELSNILRRLEDAEKRLKLLDPLIPGVDILQGKDGAFSEINIPSGGTTNQVLAKASNEDADYKWKNDDIGTANLLAPYPVGAIYMSMNPTDPGTLFGGTWTQIVERFLYASGANPGETGGSHTIIIGVNNMPSHAHSYVDTVPDTYQIKESGVSPITASPTSQSGIGKTTGYQGGGEAIQTTPPFMRCYTWYRTA